MTPRVTRAGAASGLIQNETHWRDELQLATELFAENRVTHRHNDNETRGNVRVEQVVTESAFEDENNLQTSEVPRRVNLRAIGRLVADQRQLRQFYIPVHHQRLLGVPLEHQIVRRVRHWKERGKICSKKQTIQFDYCDCNLSTHNSPFGACTPACRVDR